MILLLADDEVLTRKGLKANIPWDELNIHLVLEAEDGIQALELAKKYAPEIILTDVRMPYMDGVSFTEKIRQILPDTSIIFMSAYTDKTSLQAAIRMKAVSYIEKPINEQEVIEAVREAVHYHEIMERNRHYTHLQEREKAAELSLALTYNAASPAEVSRIDELIRSLSLPLGDNTWMQTLLVRTFPPVSGPTQPEFSAVLDSLTRLTKAKPFDFIFGLRYDFTIVFHLYAQEPPSASSLQDFYHFLGEQLSKSHNYFLAAGTPVQGPANIPNSYNQAAALLQSSFFFGYNSILTEGEAKPLPTDLLEKAVAQFSDCMSVRDISGASAEEEQLYQGLKNCRTLLPSIAKDAYFKLFLAVESAFKVQMLSEDAQKPIWDRVLSCNTLGELHTLLSDTLTDFQDMSEKAQAISGPVSIMKDYIQKNYPLSTLSVKDISGRAGLSVAYACTLFKNETGTTLNQYLTACRISRAEELLADPRIRISDVSARVGYLDGNYFGKSFKKATGLTPSEYREKLQS